MIKKLLTLFLVFTIFITNSTFSLTTVMAETEGNAKITSFSGTVSVQREGSLKSFTPFANMSISVGDKISTSKDGSVTILLNDVNTIVLGKSTSITLSKLNDIDEKPLSAYILHYGNASNDVDTKTVSDTNYKVNTVNTVMGVRGTTFDVVKKITEKGDERIQLITIEGEVEVDELNYNERKSYGEFNGLGSVFREENIVFDGQDDKNKEIISVDINKLDAEQLVWLDNNKGLLSESIKQEVSQNLEEKLSQEVEKINKLDEATKVGFSNEKVIYENTIKENNDKKKNENISNSNNTSNSRDKNVEKESDNSSSSGGSGGNSSGGNSSGGNSGSNTSDNTNDDDDYVDDSTDDDDTTEVPTDNGDGTTEEPTDNGDNTTEEPTDNGDDTTEEQTDNGDDTTEVPTDNGDGTTEEPTDDEFVLNKDIVIESAYDLNEFNRLILENSSFVIETITFNTDIDFTGYTWTPINISNCTINGNGHTISNIAILPTDTEFLGFFGSLINCIVSDLHFDNVTFVTAKRSVVKAQGILAGSITNSKILDVKITNIPSFGGSTNVGVIAGYGKNIIDMEDVIIENVDGVNATSNAGGAFGNLEGAFVSDVEMKNIGEITSTISSGGFAGSATAAAIHNVSVDNDEGVTSIKSTNNAGGIAGKLNFDAISRFTISNSSITAKNCGYYVGDGSNFANFGCQYFNVEVIDTDSIVWGNVVEITNAEELHSFNEYVLNNTSYVVSSISITNDINFEDYVWTPVDINKISFNGNNKTISNMKIESETSGNLAMFKTLTTGSSVSAINFDNVILSNSSNSSNNIGVIAGEISGSTINNISVKNLITDTVAVENIGALCGKISGSTVSNITVSDVDSLEASASTSCSGGLTGTVNSCTLSNIQIKNIGDIMATNYAGAISGKLSGLTIANSNVDTVNSVTANIAGGGFGYIYDATISNVHIVGLNNVVGDYASGGLVGEVTLSQISDSAVRNAKVIEGNDYAGGAFGKVSNNSAVINNETDDIEKIFANLRAGGLIGYNASGSFIDLNNIYNIDLIQSNSYVGGIVGELAGGSITNCKMKNIVLSGNNTNRYVGIISGGTMGSNTEQ
ncbi:MAG: FecR domain-containing protein [Lachnospirales bacterium]